MRHRRGLCLVVVLMSAAIAVVPPAFAGLPWEPVTSAELASSACPFDSTASLEGLFWRKWIQDELRGNEWRTARKVEVRLKVYSDEAAQSLASITVDLLDRESVILDLEARTIAPDGHVTVMDPRSIARATLVKLKDREMKRVTFAPPAVRAGCIVEYHYREVREGGLLTFEDHWLQQEYPVRRLEYFLSPIATRGIRQRQVTFHTRASLGNPNAEGFFPLELRDVPAWREEPLMPHEAQTRGWMLLFYTDQPVQSPRVYWREQGHFTWEKVEHWCALDRDLRKTAQEVVQGASTESERVERLIDWCRRTIRVHRPDDPDSLGRKRAPDNSDARSTLDRRAAKPLDLDLLFLALARAAGLEARFASVSQRPGFHFTQEMMAPGMMDSYLIAVRVDGVWVMVDPQHPWLPWDMVAANVEDQIALVCQEDSSYFRGVGSADAERSVRRREASLTLDEEGTLSGRVEFEWTGHWNALARQTLRDRPEPVSAIREAADWHDPALEIEEVAFTGLDQPFAPLRATVRLTIRHAARAAGEGQLLEPSVWWAMREPTFTSATRRWPVEFPFRWVEQDSIRIALPAGWLAREVASPRALSGADVGRLDLTMRPADDGHTIMCVRRQWCAPTGPRTYSPAEYATLRRYDDAVLERDRTLVALARAGSPRP